MMPSSHIKLMETNRHGALAGQAGVKRNYPLLLASQYLGAFGDNAILAVILGQLTFQQMAGQISEGQLSAANAIYTSLLFVPYVLLAPVAGYLNDRFPKTRWLAGGNGIKLLGTAVAAVSVWQGSLWQGLGYFMVGVGGCVYSPAKYGILPEIVARERLVKANGTLEFLTIAAILTGYIGGAAMIDRLPVLTCYAILGLIYTLSLGLNLIMTQTSAHPGVHLRRSVDAFFANFGHLLENPRLFRVLCGCGLFWLCAAAIKINFQPWGLTVLGLQDTTVAVFHRSLHVGVNTQIALLGLWLSVGVMLGAVLAGQLHRVGDLRRVRVYGWCMAGLVGLLGLVELLAASGALYIDPVNSGTHRPGVFEALAHAAGLGGGRWKVAFMLIAAGMIAGLFLIPLNATLQNECSPERLGKTVAAQNLVDNLSMVAAGSLILLAAKARVNASGVFLYLAALLAVVVTVLRVPPKVRTKPTLASFEPEI